jgi:phosphoribosylanthranilate isomerase
MTKIKICGLTNLADLKAVTDLGADAAGFITGVPASPRNVSLDMAKTLIKETPVFTKSVLVMVPRNLNWAIKIYRDLKPDAVQIHGEQIDTDEFGREEPNPSIIKAVSMNNSGAISTALRAAEHCDAVLLDSSTGNNLGGTGNVHNWQQSREIVDWIKPKPLILAGGLNPDNVAEAIKIVRPYAVDVCTGTERAPGIKDRDKVKAFILKVREEAGRNFE